MQRALGCFLTIACISSLAMISRPAQNAPVSDGRSPENPVGDAGLAKAVAAKSAAEAPRIEVCFVLDSTGSMGGLIDGAKQKIWSIANQMIAARPKPQLRIGLVTYRDRGDDYITKLFDLSDDIDTVYANLTKFQAGGGGDGPESVNQALHEAVTKISWSQSRDVLKIIFLVGDFPPHMDYDNDVKYPETCQAAVKKDIIINTVQCGEESSTTPVWQEIARSGEGRYVQIGQTGDVQVVATPMDEKLAALNVRVGRTLVPYGSREAQRGVMSKQAAAEAAPRALSADRLKYNSATGKAVQGRGELLDDLSDGSVKLADVKTEDLPEEMQKMSPAEREAFVQKRRDERAKLQNEIEELLKQRQAYIDAETKKLIAAGKGSAFDVQVAQMLKDQAAKKGIRYQDEK